MKSLIKYGFKEFERNILFNLFIILQITSALVLIVYCVSSINYNTKFYNPLKNYLDGNGICTNNVSNYQTLEDIKSQDFVHSVYDYNACVGFDNSNNNYYNEKIQKIKINCYDKEFIDDFKPLVEKGKWLNECESSNDVVNAVISNTADYKVGDDISVVFDPDTDMKTEVTIHIVGMLGDGAKFLNAYKVTSEVVDATSLYPNYYKDENKDEIILLTEQSLLLNGYPDLTFIRFKDGMDKSEYEHYISKLGIEYDIQGIKLNDINEKSIENIREQNIMIMPLIIGIAILIIVSVLSMTAISTNRQLKSYGIYRVTGQTSTGCVLIQMWNIVYSCIFAIACTYILLLLYNLSGNNSNLIIQIDKNVILWCLGMIVLVVVSSVIMPSLIIKKIQIKEMIGEKEV